jgi:hypothetical protein
MRSDETSSFPGHRLSYRHPQAGAR